MGSTRHGHATKKGRSPEYSAWVNMIQRCTNPRHVSYPDYGARGIKVSDRWRSEFALFLADMGSRPGPKYSLDRIDPNGNYEPANCRWLTSKEQQRNRRKRTELPTPNGSKLLVDFAEETSQSEGALRQRLASGWDPARVVEIPVKRRLTPRVIKQIYRAAKALGATTVAVAERFGVSQSTVHAIFSGRQWSDVTGASFKGDLKRKPRTEITESIKGWIRDLYSEGLSERAVAARVGVSRPVVHRCLTPEKE